MFSLKPVAAAVSGLFLLTPALAADPVQKVKPPVSQAYIDLATFAGGNPMMQGGGAGGMLGGLFGGGTKEKARGNSFGQTQAQGSQGRWMDVVVLTHNNRSLKTATQTVPAASKLAPTLKLVAPELEKSTPGGPVSTESVGEFQMPKGKMYLYWGCGTDVRKGQPLVLDLSKMDPKQYSQFFQNRSATARIPHPEPGRPGWPNKEDDRMLPEGASMAGEHAFAGDGVVDGFKFNIDANHDLMPAVQATRSDDGKAVLFKWNAMQQATGWFVQAMGMRGEGPAANGEMEMVYWTSSELPDMGMGLMNYQPDSAIAKWQKEKVILPASATECAAPKDAVSPMAMANVIAYGDELNMAYPPRPKDPKITWEPQWDVKVRRKSVASLMPGMGSMAMNAFAGERGDEDAPRAVQAVQQQGVPQQPQQQPAANNGNPITDAITRGAADAVTRGVSDLFGRAFRK